ncbi:putative hydrolase [Streptomyces sp. NBRC 110611]|uniref:polysaccharide deacetylase family protein n=1 Tax=Streptomyces sp. NBRC 110611 TaxID=1621259 RepID=UPI00082BB963|nr:polysaccharide deacetylase family protein [Streptomyces sp. NBRC 110611]GAU69313.1 putative hydrolase [Streptomyces sp. NBRC 110611]
MTLPTHGRFGYSPIVSRPHFTWPGGARLAVYVAVNTEHFAYGESGLGLSYSPGLPHPNTYNWAWREYGNRVGGFRIADALAQYDIRPTVLLNTADYDHAPELIGTFRDAGGEFVAHGRTNSVHPNELDETAERRVVDEAYRAIATHEGTGPAGWMSPGANPSAVTEDLLAERGFLYTMDWPMDDQPVWLSTRGGPLLSLPYPHEVNDVPMIVFHHGTAAAFADMIRDSFDEMLEQSRRQPLVLGISVHTFIVGQPFRLRHFRAALDHIRRNADGVWFTTAGDIARHYRDQVAPPPAPAPPGGDGSP